MCPHPHIADLSAKTLSPPEPASWRSLMPTIFRASPKRSGERITRTSTGDYNGLWRRFAKAYRRQHPFCAMCLEKDRLTFADLVDHKHPVADGGPMLPGSEGVWGLCQMHHSGWKRVIEDYARQTGQMDKIVRWCDDPSARPPKLRTWG